MMAKYTYQSEDFYLSSFISGLRHNIQQALYIYKPTSLQQAFDKVKEHEIFMERIEKKMKENYKGTSTPTRFKEGIDNKGSK